MQQEDRFSIFRDSLNVQLADGHVVDISTSRGANAFLQAGSQSKECLSNCVGRMSKICAKRRLNAKDKGDLLVMISRFEFISQYGSPDLFRLHVQQSTIKAWLDLVIEQINRLSTNRNWIATGKLATHDTALLNSCIPMMEHAVPVAFAFENDFFHVLADFVRARKGVGRALPCPNICRTITFIVSNANKASNVSFDNSWTIDKTLKKLEATGVLEQFIRCATVPQPPGDFREDVSLFQMLDLFQTCVPFISKKVRPGQPCGDVIIAILEGREGSRVERPSVLNKLRTIMRFAASIDPEHKLRFYGSKLCRKCQKVDLSESLMKCGRCKEVYYCSKECQKADWKTHKEACKPMTEEEVEMSKFFQQTLFDFCERNYAHIMVKMVEACEQTGLSKNDMLMELNFSSNENGIVPAMQDKPEFNIAPVKDYIEGSRPAEPEWFRKTLKGEKYEEAIKVYLAQIEEEHRNLQPDQILCFVMITGGFSVRRLSSREPITNKDMYSQEAVNAFKTYMNDGDDGLLSEIFEPRKLANLKGELDYAL